MRILFATASTGWSGGADQVFKLACCLRSAGHDAAVACPAEGDLFRRLAGAGAPAFAWRPFQDYDFRSALALSRLARSWRADVLHAQHPKAHAMALLAGLTAPRLPIVVTRHVAFPIPRNPFSRLKYRTRRLARIVAVSPAVEKCLLDAGVEASRIAVIPPGIDLRAWESVRRSRSATLQPPFVATMVAHYSRFKGHEVFLAGAAAALRLDPDLRFVIVGRGAEVLRPLARSLGVADRVQFLGEREDVADILSRSHCLVVPSLSEAFSLALVEAMAGKVPVVASRVGGIPRIVKHGRSGLLFPPGDAPAMAHAILALARDPALGNRLASRGYESVCGRYSIEAVAEQHQRLYRTVLRAGATAAATA